MGRSFSDLSWMTCREIKKPKPTTSGADPAPFFKELRDQRPAAERRVNAVYLLFLCLLVFSIVFNFSETTLARGVLIPAQGDVEVRARESGTIVDFAVRPGQYVKENDPLLPCRRTTAASRARWCSSIASRWRRRKSAASSACRPLKILSLRTGKTWRSSWILPTGRLWYPATK